MKRLLFLSIFLVSIIACNKEEEKMTTEALPSAVDLFEGQYHEESREISLTWRYGSSSEISHFELFYSPGQDSVEKLDNWASSYSLYPVSANKTYLFNIRAIDLYGKYSEARVVYINTTEEE
jgi:hypothetical protein